MDDSVDPVRDLETITSELCKKDQVKLKDILDHFFLSIVVYLAPAVSSFLILILETLLAGEMSYYEQN